MTWRTRYLITVDYFKSNLTNISIQPSETEILNPNCNVCDIPLVPFITVSNKDAKPILEKRVCLTCGFICFTRMPKQTWFEVFYREKWDAKGRAAVDNSRPAHAYSDNIRKLAEVAPNRDARILDIGAGFGGFLLSAQNNGFTNVEGIEASAHRSKYCRESLGLAVNTIPVEKISDCFGSLRKESLFDIIHSHHVLEHVYDLDKAISNFYQLLKPGGHVIFFVPNWLKVEPLVNVGHFLGHVRHFTPVYFSKLLAKHGFEITSVDDSLCIVARRTSAEKAQIALQTTLESSTVIAEIEHKVAKEFFGNKVQVSPLLTRFYFSGPNNWLHFPDDKGRARWLPLQIIIKKFVFGVMANDQAIRGPAGNPFRLLQPSFFIRKLLSKILVFDKYEMGGTLITSSDSQSDLTAPPLVDFRYKEPFGVGSIK
jgi:2-polyprenyl-3-methyl-5-hydroxy-6-metoxy-1,4-benzoquinol methylase